MSYIASRIVPLNVDKNGEMFCDGFCKKSVSYNTYGSDSSSWILNGLVSSCFDVDTSDDESGMAKGILFKPRVEPTEQMAQNCMDISESKNQRERKIASKWHV